MNLEKCQSGSSLVGVLAVIVAAAGLSALMVQTSERDTASYTELTTSTNTLFSTESALEAARWSIKNACSNPPNPPENIVNSQYEVHFTETAPGSGIYTVVTTAFAPGGGVSRTIVAEGVRCESGSPLPPTWTAGISACEWIKAAGSSTYSFNSCTLEGDDESRADMAVVNDGGFLTKTGSGRIHGNIILPGSGAYVEMSGSAKVKGDILLTGARGDKGYFKHSGSGDVLGQVSVPGNVILSGSSKITGDVTAGGTISITGSARIRGETHVNTAPPTTAIACDPFGVDHLIESARPDAETNLGNFQQSGSSNTILTAGTYYYNSFSMSGSGDLILARTGDGDHHGDYDNHDHDGQGCHRGHHKRHRHHHHHTDTYNHGDFRHHDGHGHDHHDGHGHDDDRHDAEVEADPNSDFYLFIDGPFQMSGSAKLILQEGVHLTIFHTGGANHTDNFTVTGSGSINLGRDNGQTEIYSNTTGKITVSGSGDLAAAIYAPRAAVEISGSGDFYGASHSKTFEITGSGDAHFDRYLGVGISDATDSTKVVMTDWSEQFIQ